MNGYTVGMRKCMDQTSTVGLINCIDLLLG